MFCPVACSHSWQRLSLHAQMEPCSTSTSWLLRAYVATHMTDLILIINDDIAELCESYIISHVLFKKVFSMLFEMMNQIKSRLKLVMMIVNTCMHVSQSMCTVER